MFVIMYKEHGMLNCEARVVGPFGSHDEAYDVLCMMPALGSNECGPGYAGWKYVEEVISPLQCAKEIGVRQAKRNEVKNKERHVTSIDPRDLVKS